MRLFVSRFFALVFAASLTSPFLLRLSIVSTATSPLESFPTPEPTPFSNHYHQLPSLRPTISRLNLTRTTEGGRFGTERLGGEGLFLSKSPSLPLFFLYLLLASHLGYLLPYYRATTDSPYES